VAESLVHLFGQDRAAFAGLRNEELIERISVSVADRLGTTSKPQGKRGQRYVRDVEAAKYLGVSPATLRSWRSKRLTSGPPVTRMGNMVMYSLKSLEQYMEERTRADW
jgi:predicted DNA-binding transcriptional regulator AlpA